jgi:hypothetical protein
MILGKTYAEEAGVFPHRNTLAGEVQSYDYLSK